MESALPRHHILRQNDVRRVRQDAELPRSLVQLPSLGDRSRTVSKGKSLDSRNEEKSVRSLPRKIRVHKEVTRKTSAQSLDSESFRLLHPIGMGTFGKVWKAVHVASGANYAIKKLSKLQITRKGAQEAILMEKKFLELMKNK